MSAENVAKGVATSGAGTASVLLGEMPILSGAEWAVLVVIVLLSVGAGAMARQGQVEQRDGVTPATVIKERRWAVMVFGAQFLFGMVLAAQADGNIWITIPACLVIGWTGNTFLQWLAKRSGIE